MSKMYKYTSLSSAIKIIKSGKILLNEPSKFNDPFDCAFFSDEFDEQKSFELVFNYFAIKKILMLINDNKIILTNRQKKIFNIVRIEFNLLKKMLNINPYYYEIPIINKFIKSIIKTKPELSIDLNKVSEEFKKNIENNLEYIKKTSLISCFSKRNDSILMWSHYADAHRGVCLEFDQPKQKEFENVKYTNKRSTLKMFKFFSIYIAHDFIEKQIKINKFKCSKDLVKPFFTKSKDWSYEEEIRCLFSINDYEKNKIIYDGENYFADVGKIKRIFIGSKAKGLEIDELIKLAKNRNIEVVFMKESLKEFKIIPDFDYKYEKSAITKKETTVSLLINIEEIKSALEKNLYISAFVLALNIPAICGAKEYENCNEEEQYKRWTYEYFSKYEKSCKKTIYKIPYLSKELLFDIRKEYLRHGTFNVRKDYQEFQLDRFILKIESKKPYNLYVESAGITNYYEIKKCAELKINVRDFCLKLCSLGENFYQANKKLFNQNDNILIEDYDKNVDEYKEFLILNKRDE